MGVQVSPLSTMNTNYDPPQPWRCQATFAPRPATPCTGTVVGAVGATPVCAACAPVEVAAYDAHRARVMAMMDTPAMRREARREQAWEARVS